MRLLGLDHGKKRIGVAVSDPLDVTAQPLPYIPNDMLMLDNLKELVSRYSVSRIVLGSPIRMSGEAGPALKGVERFRDLLQKELGLDVVMWDERLTTKMAARSYTEAGTSSKKMRPLLDSAAAGLMLQSYMDSKKHEKPA